MDEKFAKWKGVNRSEINWNPKIDESKCIGCGMCVTSCETWCIFNAISFPDKKIVKDLIKENGLLKVAKKELEEKLDPKPCSCTG